MTWGESHGPAMGAVVDGCPAGLDISELDIDRELARDVPDVAIGTTRKESNKVTIMSGVFEGRTLGTPISMVIENTAARSEFYRKLRDTPRPGHGDLTWRLRYGHVDWRGGSRSSGRECIARLAAAAVARKILTAHGVTVSSNVIEMAGIPIEAAADLERAREEVIRRHKENDSTGGMVRVTITGVPPGLGAPVFDKVEADLAMAVLSIGAVKSFAIGDGCRASCAIGSEFNDPIVTKAQGSIGTSSNRSGGLLGGISTGEDIWFEFKVKPTPSISMTQKSVNIKSGEAVDITTNGHFDANITPRAAVVGEAMACLVIVDHMLDSGIVHPTRIDASGHTEK